MHSNWHAILCFILHVILHFTLHETEKCRELSEISFCVNYDCLAYVWDCFVVSRYLATWIPKQLLLSNTGLI